jgi:hypothetical protein
LSDEQTVPFASPDQAPDSQEPDPEPARDALEEPNLSADELEKEIGDSEPWDEASEDAE